MLYNQEINKEKQEDEEDLRVALERINRPNRKFLTSEEVYEKLKEMIGKKLNV